MDIKAIKAIISDIDGVLTDGSIGYGCGSDDEIKFFNVKDGSGFQLARHAGIKIASISGRISKANRRRLTELHFDAIMEKVTSKADCIRELCDGWGITPENVMYLGDDLIDLPAFAIVGLTVAPSDAAELVRENADWVTAAAGGHGCAREAIERLLREQGVYDDVISKYISDLVNRKRNTQ